MTGHPLGHVREAVLSLPEYDLKILLNGYPAHSARCHRASAQRDRIRQPDYDPSDRVRNERLDVVCDCGTDRRYTRYLEDQLQALRAQVPAAAGDDALAREVHAAWRDGMLSQSREVAPHRMIWDTLSPEDHALDAYIAQRVASAALRAQAEAGAGEADLLAELREALTAFDAANAEEDAALNVLMSASQNAPKNERGQYLDPGAVHRAAEPFRPRHRAAQDARLEAQDIIDGLALESARLAVKLAGGLPALAQADAGSEG